MSNLQNNTTDLQSILDAVNALPDAVDTSGVTATAGHVLAGDKFVDSSGKLTDGSMPNNGAFTKTMDGVNAKSVTVPAGYTSGGSVSLDSTIDNAVAAMKTALTDKGVTVPDDADVIGLADLIAAIEAGGGDIVCGQFIPAESAGEISGAYTQEPCFFAVCEIPSSVSDTEHTQNRVLIDAMKKKSRLASDTGGHGARLYSATGSTSLTTKTFNSTYVFGNNTAPYASSSSPTVGKKTLRYIDLIPGRSYLYVAVSGGGYE